MRTVMSKRRITLSDVARRAGVSKVTVSNILNNRPTAVPISEATRQRVLEAVQELGYYPNAVARALARQRADAIAIVLQFPAIFQGWSGFTNELMRGVSHKATELGYDILLHTRSQPTVELEARSLMDGRVDGALLLRDYNDPLHPLLLEREFPHVLFFTRSPYPNAYWVDCDNYKGAQLATEHLIQRGHERIVHLSGPPTSCSALDRLQGYRETLQQHGLSLPEDYIIPAHYAGADLSRLAQLLHTPKRPTAIFAWSDEVAIRAMNLCIEEGLRVPEDIAVVGFDSTETCNHTNPPLTSVRQPIEMMAATALEMLVRLICGEQLTHKTRVYAPELDIRGSCGAQGR